MLHQVLELELAKEYALRVKELAAQELLSAQAAKHAEELRTQSQALLDLQKETDLSLAERDHQMQQADEKHQVCHYPTSANPLYNLIEMSVRIG